MPSRLNLKYVNEEKLKEKKTNYPKCGSNFYKTLVRTTRSDEDEEYDEKKQQAKVEVGNVNH